LIFYSRITDNSFRVFLKKLLLLNNFEVFEETFLEETFELFEETFELFEETFELFEETFEEILAFVECTFVL
jgi:hypothetical protein